jgi:prevent-host-death family protein
MVVAVTQASAQLGELVHQVRREHESITLTEHGKPVAAIIGVDELADLEDWAALAKHEADKARGLALGVSDDDLDAALDSYQARNL